MRLAKYLRESKIAVFLIIVLLVIQAYTDLSLPHYTSEIVDVGIQQSGIEHAAVERMSEDTFEAVCMLSSPQDEEFLRSAYVWQDGGVFLRQEVSGEELSRLDDIVSLPLALVHLQDLTSGMTADQSEEGSQQPFDVSSLLSAYQAGAVTKDEVLAGVEQARDAMGESGDSIIAQQGIAAAKFEYEKVGEDVGAIQMSCLLGIGARMAALTAVGALAAVGVGFLAARTAAKVGMNLRERLFRRVVGFSDAEIGKFSAASLITRGTNDIQQIQTVMVMMLRMVVYSPILAIGGIFMVSRTNAAMSWIIALAVACLFVVIAFLMVFAMPKFKAMQKLIDRVNLVAREMLTGLPVVRAFGRQGFEEARFDQASRDLMRTQLFTNRVMTFMMPAMMLIMNGVSVLVVWVGGSYIDDGTIQTGDMIAFITYSMVIIMSFLIIGMVSIMLPRADVAAQRVNEVLDTVSSIEDPAFPKDSELGDGAGARLSFDDVTFFYGGGKDGGAPALDRLDFEVGPGEVLAIVGSTGSGKSTALKLVERFYDVSDGAVRIDGIDVRDLSQAALRRTVAYVPQKAFLFSGTIASNVAYAEESMDRARIEEALRIAQAKEFVEAKEDGCDSRISQGGTNVSGGQRQRLCIARAIASDARILLFDDSFSALDYKTDASLRAALRDSLGDRTLVIVAQRISTVVDADLIVVLDDGRMVGKGTHRELLESCPEYREIAFSQLSEKELTGGDAA